MGFLAPLYIAGFLAVGIPILLHLIKRTPQGRQMFSSLMFLTPSPPRITRRSRLNNLLLLLLRALALIMLAFAFARPFFNVGENRDSRAASGRRYIFLVDVSASMRRPDLWAEAGRRVEDALSSVTPADEVGLYFFDRQVKTGLSVAQWNEADPALRLALFKARLAEASPGWAGTRLGDCLAAAADLASENSSAADVRRVSRQVVLVTDLQEGGKAETLQGHEWPKEVDLRVLTVSSRQPGNASIQWVKSGNDAAGIASNDGTLRVQVTNQSDSNKEQFTLAWGNAKGPLPGAPQPVYVAPGRSQMVRLPAPPEDQAADRLVLSGDASDFDNVLYIVPPEAQRVRVVYVGDEAATDVNAMRYYFQSALFDSPQRRMEYIGRAASDPVTENDLRDARLVVVTRPPSDGEIALLDKHVRNGGEILWVGRDGPTMARAGALLGRELRVEEATGEYALLSRIDLSHPLFTPFADVRFADFTKIHFWKHRRVSLEGVADWHVLAAFDDGMPYMAEASLGKGVVRFMTSGWQPTDSQMALSSKFLPLLDQMVRRRDALAVGAQFAVDDPVPLPAGTSGSIIGPDGKSVALASAASFAGTSLPGVYALKSSDGAEARFAVNLSPDESRTIPMVEKDLDQWGIRLNSPEFEVQQAREARILLNNELENRQKSWQWLLLAVLGLLALETALAGRLTRSPQSASQERAVT